MFRHLFDDIGECTVVCSTSTGADELPVQQRDDDDGRGTADDAGGGRGDEPERARDHVEEFVAVGDSTNDASTFRVAGRSFAVANADADARAAADEVVEESYADGFLAAVERVSDES